MSNKLSNFTEKDTDKVAKKYLNSRLHKPSNKKIAYVLGGQPGAGKSAILNKADKELNGKVVIVNADDFRVEHPNYKKVLETYGSESAKHTGLFSGKTAEKVIKYSIERNQNLAIEGTFRTSEIPLKTLKELKENGYETRVEIMTTDKETSYQSTINRYNEAINSNNVIDKQTARLTPKDHHDLVVHTLPNNAKTILESNLADKFRVSTRNGVIYDKSNHLFNKTDIEDTLKIALEQKKIRSYLNEKINNSVDFQKADEETKKRILSIASILPTKTIDTLSKDMKNPVAYLKNFSERDLDNLQKTRIRMDKEGYDTNLLFITSEIKGVSTLFIS